MKTKKPIYMYLSEVKKSSGKFDATHKVALYPDSVDIQIPAWFKKFHEEEFKPLQETVIRMQNEPPKWFSDFANQVINRLDKNDQMWEKQMQFNKMILNRIDHLEKRIDNLVTTNNLKE